MSATMTLASMRAVLRQGAALDRCSLLLLAAVIVLLGITDAPASIQLCYALSVAAGVVQRVWAFRVGLDADLLEAVLQQIAIDNSDEHRAAQQLDQALQTIGLLRTVPAPRDWLARWAGMRRLLLRQVGSVMVQMLALCAALIGKALL
ncbi:hypothetical protein FHR49_001745 [Xanthomonas campestris]